MFYQCYCTVHKSLLKRYFKLFDLDFTSQFVICFHHMPTCNSWNNLTSIICWLLTIHLSEMCKRLGCTCVELSHTWIFVTISNLPSNTYMYYSKNRLHIFKHLPKSCLVGISGCVHTEHIFLLWAFVWKAATYDQIPISTMGHCGWVVHGSFFNYVGSIGDDLSSAYRVWIFIRGLENKLK